MRRDFFGATGACSGQCSNEQIYAIARREQIPVLRVSGGLVLLERTE
jgi:hypothetical protein